MKPGRGSIVLIGFAVEGALALIFFIWAYFRDFHERWYPTAHDIALGLLGTLFLCLVNYVAFKVVGGRLKFLRSSMEFIDTVVKPLADQLDPFSSLIVSLCAGIGEELFFRGVLQNELGLIAASVLFAVLHFGRAIREYLDVASIYLLIGLYFGIIYQLTGTLWVGIVLHASYDFCALLYFRYYYDEREAWLTIRP